MPQYDIVSTTTLRCADGSTCDVTGDSVTNYVFDPVFVRFVVLGILIHSLLMSREYPGISGTTEYFTLWGAVMAAIMGWLVLSGSLLLYLYRKGWIASIYTPLISLPVVIISEYVSQGISIWLTEITWDASGVTFMLVLKHMGVIICFDIIHMRYVAPIHPLVVRFTQGVARHPGTVAEFDKPAAPQATAPDAPEAPQPRPATPAPTPAPAAEPKPTAPAAPTDQDKIIIKQHVISTADITLMRTEDHYLSIRTQSGDIMVRSKLSEVSDKLGPDLGMIVNRSTWVAFKAIRETTAITNGRLEVTLDTGDAIVVPKLRKHSFEQSYRMYLRSQGDAG